MSDLISKKQLVDLAYSRIDGIDRLCGQHRPDASDWEYAVENTPAVDAEPVRHGHWIWCTNHWECSVCRNNRFANYLVLGLDAAYCSYCGAKMDEVIE